MLSVERQQEIILLGDSIASNLDLKQLALTDNQVKILGECVGEEIGTALIGWLNKGNRASQYSTISAPEHYATELGKAIGQALKPKEPLI